VVAVEAVVEVGEGGTETEAGMMPAFERCSSEGVPCACPNACSF